jgi:hypothetical protein
MAQLRRLALSLVLLAVGYCPASLASPVISVVYDQPPTSPVVSARASQFITPPGAFNFQTFDNFTLSADASLFEVRWRGAYFNTLIAPTDPPVAPNATGFGVAFYADNGGIPGALLSVQTFTPTEAGETSLGTQFAPGLNLTLALFDYAAFLPTTFAAAGVPYWLSVYALSPPPSATEAQWGWVGGTGGDGVSYQSGVGVVNFDRAFTLFQITFVPEPASIGLLLGGLALLLGIGRFARR